MEVSSKDWTFSSAMIPISCTMVAFYFGLKAISHSPDHRKYPLHLVAIPTILAFLTQEFLSPDDLLNDLFGRTLIMWLAHMSFLLCFLAKNQARNPKVTIDHVKSEIKGPRALEDSSVEVLSHRESLRLAYKLLFNGRGIRTNWQIRSVPTGSTGRSMRSLKRTTNPLFNTIFESPQHSLMIAHNPDQASHGIHKSKDTFFVVPPTRPRRNFIILRLFTFLCRYVLLCIYWDGFLAKDAFIYQFKFENNDFAPSKLVYFRRIIPTVLHAIFGQSFTERFRPSNPITVRETLIRIWNVIDQFFPDWAMLSAWYDILAILFVGSGLDDPDEWPPFFGDIRLATSLRGFWGKFWHQLVYNSHGAIGNHLSHKILGKWYFKLALGRILGNTFVFALSGSVHSFIEWYGMDVSLPGKYPYLLIGAWFWLQPVGLVVETCIQKLWYSWKGAVKQNRVSWWENWIGHLWVVLWFMWSVPRTSYPAKYVPILN